MLQSKMSPHGVATSKYQSMAQRFHIMIINHTCKNVPLVVKWGHYVTVKASQPSELTRRPSPNSLPH